MTLSIARNPDMSAGQPGQHVRLSSRGSLMLPEKGGRTFFVYRACPGIRVFSDHPRHVKAGGYRKLVAPGLRTARAARVSRSNFSALEDRFDC
jgi:hypothetical protein